MQIGQNGLVWIDGSTDGIAKAMKAMEIVNTEKGKIDGTEIIKEFLEGEKK